MLTQIVYLSTPSKALTQDELKNLLEKSRKKNQSAGITGMLLYIDNSFLQVIEGPTQAVENLFAKINAHPRHVRIAVLNRKKIKSPDFSDWSMGFANIPYDALKKMEGANSFFESYEKLSDIRSADLHNLLKVFKLRASN
jgi:hypothetical protein